MAKNFKVGNTLICEHIIRGENNKLIFIHAYTGDILLSDFPSDILFDVFIELDTQSVDELDIEIEFEIGCSVFNTIRGRKPKDNEHRTTTIVAQKLPFHFENATSLKIFARAHGMRRTLLLEKAVRRNPPAAS